MHEAGLNAQSQQSTNQVILERPNQPPIVLSNDDIVSIIKQQQLVIEELTKRNSDMNTIIQKMQEKILELRNSSVKPVDGITLSAFCSPNTTPVIINQKSKSDPEIQVILKK